MKKKRKRKLKKVVNLTLVNAFERMKTLEPDNRFALLLEIGEWAMNEWNADDELLVPQFKMKEGK